MADRSGRGRRLRVGVENGTESGLQRLEPRLVVSPVFKRIAENGLTNLLGARGAHGALVLVEPQASLLEGQSAVLQQAAHLGFRVLDQRLVEHTVYAARQLRIEVRHESDVVVVIASEVLEVIGEALPARKVLLEAGEAASERMAPDIDDAGVGQDQLNQSDIETVV